MAQVHAFRGIGYDLGRVGALADVIAPPYDVIDTPLSDSLHAKSEYNVIRLILDPIRPTDNDADNRYTRTAALLKRWRREGILVDDPEPAIYAYFQTFDWEGQTYTRRGFMARVRLEKFGEGRIYPHEETMSGPKADRLKLFHATGVNLSQIFGLYPDEENSVAELLEQKISGQTPLEAVDHLGVVHRLWRITDPQTISQVQGLLGPKPVFIADGHHRYETGCKHLEERQQAGMVRGPDDPAHFILMMMVGMSEPGLRIMPTHRLVTGVGDLTAEQLRQRLDEYFTIEPMGAGRAAGETTWESIETSGSQDAIGLCTVVDGQWTLATLKSATSMDAVVKDHSPTWKSLGVSILHKLILEHLLASKDTLGCRYVHRTVEVLDAVDARECQLGCLVQSANVEHIRQLAGTFEVMPAKSTYFYPKLASGLVFNPIH